MDKGVYVLLTALAGGLIALQAPINAGLGRATGSLPAALVSFGMGTLALAAIVVLSGQAGGLGAASRRQLVLPARRPARRRLRRPTR